MHVSVMLCRTSPFHRPGSSLTDPISYAPAGNKTKVK